MSVLIRMLDNKRYSIDNCHLVEGNYHCAYNGFISSIAVRDLAGNLQSKTYKLER